MNEYTPETTCIFCDNPDCENANRNLIYINPDEWEECCQNTIEIGPLSYEEMEAVRNADDLPTVDLVAAGYDWTCPACNHEHFTTEFYDQVVTCVNCDKKYTAMIAHPEM